ncbi:ATP-binding protein [Nocardioides sp. GCM10027113]|uniref:ATP-binding protein n=1 Tax=unclassified Nocardioides TaxID=2615069 RepID=UPI0036209ED5
MDWYLTREDPAAVTALRHQVTDYLTRHADPGSDIGDAELVFQELVVNALRHTDGPAWVQLTWVEEQPDVVIRDLGSGFDLDSDLTGRAVAASDLDPSDTGGAPYDEDLPDLMSEGGRGLFLVSHLAEELAVAVRDGGGSRVQARLPVRRAASRSIHPPRPLTGALPALDEAQPNGGFDKESFLRALVVQLSQAVEHAGGPEMGEETVAEVGIAVGGQMEAEFRAARQVLDRLSPEQMAECFVRLKHAIDGRFYVIEVSEDRIVLGNERCPFGNAVRKSPALCRMTSAVFGGIAARNHPEGSAVVLEERIAVGDPGCRVVVHLGEAPESSRRFAHRYQAPSSEPAAP